MAVGFSNTNKPINPRGQDASPLAYNRAKLYSGKALDFDGVNDSITTNLNTTIFSDSGTISGYLNLDGLGGVKAGFGFRLSNQSEFYFLFVDNNSEFRLRTTDGITDVVTDLSEFVGRWTLFTCTFGAGVMSLYANDTLIASENYTGDFRVNASSYYVFGESGGGAFWYDGLASNARVFNTALTAAQVADLYNNPEKVVPTGVDNTALKLWLPMMEGAGTTAYDGSGNGNHGTISGATYVNGIGAPVSQSAVMDWNKGSNYLEYSNNFAHASWLKLAAGGGSIPTITAEYTTGPSGKNDASRLQASNTGGGGGDYSIIQVGISTSTTDATAGVWVKSNTGSNQTIYFRTDGADSDSTAVVTTEWTRIEKTGLSIASTIYNTIGLRGSSTGTSSIDISIWGASLEKASSIGPYVYTNGTAQTSPVLLPQGLTSGRDITGVNLFENVRKQGALNLDGNSWAEVHDNASLDMTTGLSLESWIYIEDATTQGRILNKWGASSADRSYQIFMNNAVVRFLIGDGTSQNGLNSATSLSVGNWHHIVGTYDSTNIKIYIDGSEDVSVAETFSLVNSTDTLYIGTYYNQTNTSVNPLAQPRIYNRALTASEVLRNYNSGKNTYK